MTAEEYLKAVIERNPALGKPDDEKVTLTCRGIRALIRQAFAMGEQRGAELRKAEEKLNRAAKDIFNPFPWAK